MKLSPSELEQALNTLPGWAVKEGQLFRKFEFGSYAHGALFVSACAHLADQVDHHPDLFLGYQFVTVGLETHSEGGITAKDIQLANRITQIYTPS